MALECRYEQGPLPPVPEQPRIARSMLKMIAAHHGPTYLHLHQVAHYTAALARHVGLDYRQVKMAYTAGLLHDIGKVLIPLEILTKPGRLTDAEKAIMEKHPALGAQIAIQGGAARDLGHAIRHHHEWWGGCGYPAKLAGNEIPLISRMIAIADAFDSMTTPRPYRNVVSVEDALGELARCTGTQFDPELAPEFIAMMHIPNHAVRSILPYTTPES